MKRGAQKGQVSIFIIVAVVVLLAIGVLAYLHSIDLLRERELPDKLTPVIRYMNTCLKGISKDAVTLVGIQGGYTKLPEQILDNPDAYIQLGGGFGLPYWYAQGKDAIPSTEQIAAQISAYVQNRVNECDFGVLNQSYSVLPRGKPIVNTFVKENAVEVQLKYPLEVKSAGSSARIENFKVEVPVRLGKILRLARGLMDGENREAFLEQKTIDLMATDDMIPFTSLAFTCVPKHWKVAELESELQQVLKYNLPRIRVMKTQYMPFEKPLSYYENLPSKPLAGVEGDASDTAEYSMLRWDPLSELFDGLKVGLAYVPEWGMQFRVSPSQGGDMQSTSVQGGSFGDLSLVGACIQFYHFTYDLSYPVRVSIFDSSSLDNGYSFNFAFPVIVYHNQGMRHYEPHREVQLFGEQDFCSELSNKSFSVLVQDAKSFESLKNVSIQYQCLKYMCKLGNTDMQHGMLTTQLPEGCYGGFIVAERNGYLKTAKQLNGSQSVNVYMLPLKQMNVSVRAYDNETGLSSKLAKDEKASVYLSNDEQELYMVYSGIPKELGIINSDTQYKLSVYLFKGDELIGGYKGSLNLSQEMLLGKHSLELYAYSFPDKEGVINLINRLSNTLEPELK